MAEAKFGIVDAPGSFAKAGTWPTWPVGEVRAERDTLDVVAVSARGSVEVAEVVST